MLPEIGKSLIVFGMVLIVLGMILTFGPFMRVGRLPGDIYIQRDNWNIYIPITTCIILSILFSAVLWIISIFRR